jgi:hypothetical protein
MDNLNYRRYLADPAVRNELDAEVLRLRQQAIEDYIVAPIKRALRRLRRTQPATNAPVVTLSRAAAMEMTVRRGDTLCIDDAQGCDITASSGCLWITQQDDTSDYVVGPYQVFHVDRNGKTLIHAFRQASVHIAYRAEPGRRHSPTPSADPAYHVFGTGIAPAV